MALYNVARHIRGHACEVRCAANVAGEIKVGDALILASSKAIRASSMADAGTKAQNQEAAHDVFLGFSIDQKRAGETRDVLIATRGVFKLPCAALGQAYDLGTYFGLAGTGASAAVGVSDYEVEPVATANLAIGRLAKPAASGDTTVEVEIAGVLTTTHAGTQTMA